MRRCRIDTGDDFFYFLGGEAKNWPEASVPNADACWLMRIITADSACIAIPKILLVKFLSRLTNEELLRP